MANSGSTDARPASDTKLQIRRTFQASPDRLFAAWTTPEELKRWHAPGQLTVAVADVDLRMGGATASRCKSRMRARYTR